MIECGDMTTSRKGHERKLESLQCCIAGDGVVRFVHARSFRRYGTGGGEKEAF